MREGLTNVKTILGTATDPGLPSGLHAVLMVDTYPQVADPVSLVRQVSRALAPGGRFGIVDFKQDGAGGPGPPLVERDSPEVIKAHAIQAGMTLVSHETFLRYQYLLVFSRSQTSGSSLAATAALTTSSSR
jgi:hypothetical protein